MASANKITMMDEVAEPINVVHNIPTPDDYLIRNYKNRKKAASIEPDGCMWIPFERGVCGAAARTKLTQWVRDVHKRPDHIACSTSTNSEVVVPIVYEEEVVAVLDVDSDLVNAFSAEDVAFLELVAKLVASKYKPV